MEPPVASSNIAHKVTNNIMAKNTKPGTVSKETKELLAQEAETKKRNAELQKENEQVEAKKAEAAKEESENQAPPIADVRLPDDKRKKAWEAFLKVYEESNPVKYAAKKARGEFKEIPATFTGRNQLIIKQ